MIPENSGKGEKVSKEGKEAKTGSLLSRLLLWATEAQSCRGPLRYCRTYLRVILKKGWASSRLYPLASHLSFAEGCFQGIPCPKHRSIIISSEKPHREEVASVPGRSQYLCLHKSLVMCVEGLWQKHTDSVCQWGYMIDAKRQCRDQPSCRGSRTNP